MDELDIMDSVHEVHNVHYVHQELFTYRKRLLALEYLAGQYFLQDTFPSLTKRINLQQSGCCWQLSNRSRSTNLFAGPGVFHEVFLAGGTLLFP